MVKAPPCVRLSTPSQSQRAAQRGPSSCAAGETIGISSGRRTNLPLPDVIYAGMCSKYPPFVSSFSSPESRKDFLKTIHSILREKHRRQLLKTESLPLNQQYVPFGGKRLCALKGARPAINRAGEFQSAAASTLQQSHVPVSEFGPRETSRELCQRQ